MSCIAAYGQMGKSFGEIAWKESAISVRPGIPGKVPFWNQHAKRFIFAPAFDFKPVKNAVKYSYKVTSEKNGKIYSFEDNVPYAPLSPVWASVPVGDVEIKVIGISAGGDSLGIAGQRKTYRAAPFNGIYHTPAMSYGQSAMKALENLLDEDYVKYWLENKKPDMGYTNYKYPAKIYSALVIGAITQARLKPNTAEAKKAIELARIVADFMMDLRYKPGTAWEHFVPTYYGKKFPADKPHMHPINNFTIMGVDAGYAFLDMFDYTGDKKYLDAAKLIAQTYLKNQMENGSWYQFVNHETNAPVAKNIAIPTSVINYFDRLSSDYKVKGLENATKKAFNYIMLNPVKTYDWQGQFEDVYARPPFVNLSREQSCDLAIYLLNNGKDNPENIKLAEELIRFSEDQFVIWEQPRRKTVPHKNEGRNPENWITPSVQEQYVFWYPVGRAAGIMVDTYWHAYNVTKNDMYLAKAKSLANSFVMVQKEHDGDYPTFFTKYKLPLWLNSSVYPAKILMELENNIKKIN
ncbi:MAG TPA: hypothetical protein VGD22_12340 [Sphingobacteriaceae bacterium]